MSMHMSDKITKNTTSADSAQLPGIARPTLLLRVEGIVLLAAAVWLYILNNGNWLLFVLLLLSPDLSALGYLVNGRLGATLYNLVHTYIFPALLLAYGFLSRNTVVVTLALIWFAHIGMDRMMGYGLKASTNFKQTHLS